MVLETTVLILARSRPTCATSHLRIEIFYFITLTHEGVSVDFISQIFKEQLLSVERRLERVGRVELRDLQLGRLLDAPCPVYPHRYYV